MSSLNDLNALIKKYEQRCEEYEDVRRRRDAARAELINCCDTQQESIKFARDVKTQLIGGIVRK
jgi:hypothetical protein